MKRIFALLLVVVLVIGLAGCGSGKTTDEQIEGSDEIQEYTISDFESWETAEYCGLTLKIDPMWQEVVDGERVLYYFNEDLGLPYISLGKVIPMEINDKEFLVKAQDDYINLVADGATLLEEEFATINGIDGLLRSYEQDQTYKEEIFATIYKGETIFLIAHSEEEVEADYADAIAYFFDSIKLSDGGTNPFVAESEESNISEPDESATPPEPATSTETVSQKNAVQSAKDYLDLMGFSRQGLIDQLEYEGFPNEDAVYGADNSNADWMKEAEESAESYMDISPFSRQGLIDQLLYEGFSSEQAEHGADYVGL
jgi:hypothetical protein